MHRHNGVITHNAKVGATWTAPGLLLLRSLTRHCACVCVPPRSLTATSTTSWSVLRSTSVCWSVRTRSCGRSRSSSTSCGVRKSCSVRSCPHQRTKAEPGRAAVRSPLAPPPPACPCCLGDIHKRVEAIEALWDEFEAQEDRDDFDRWTASQTADLESVMAAKRCRSLSQSLRDLCFLWVAAATADAALRSGGGVRVYGSRDLKAREFSLRRQKAEVDRQIEEDRQRLLNPQVVVVLPDDSDMNAVAATFEGRPRSSSRNVERPLPERAACLKGKWEH